MMPKSSEIEGLTAEQSAMLDCCVTLGAAWVTDRGSVNEAVLERWSDDGWFEEVPPPAGLTTVRAYRITDAGRAALSARPRP